MRASAFMDTEEQAELRATARKFLSRRAPERDVQIWDEEGSYPEQLYREIAKLGWYDMVTDADEPVENVAGLLTALCEEVGRASSDLVALLNLNFSGIRDLARWGTPTSGGSTRHPYSAATADSR